MKHPKPGISQIFFGYNYSR